MQSSFHCSELEDFTLSPHDAVAEPSRPWPVSQPGVSCADGFLNHSLLSIKKVTFVIAAISALCTDSFKAHSQKGIHHCALMLLWLFFLWHARESWRVQLFDRDLGCGRFFMVLILKTNLKGRLASEEAPLPVR